MREAVGVLVCDQKFSLKSFVMPRRQTKKGFFAALRRLVIFLLVVGVVGGGALSYALYLWNTVPVEYESVQTRRQHEAEIDRRQRAFELEKRFIDTVHHLRLDPSTSKIVNPSTTSENSSETHVQNSTNPTAERDPKHKPAVSHAEPQRSAAGFYVPGQVVDDPVRRTTQPGQQPVSATSVQAKASPDARTRKPSASSPGQSQTHQHARTGTIRSTRAGDRVHFAMTMDEANDWLEFGLPRWVANNGQSMPPTVSNFSIASNDGHPVIMFLYNDGQLDQIVSVRFYLEFQGQGEAKLVVHSIKGGELPVPVSTLTNIVVSMFPPAAQSKTFERVHSMFQGQPFDPSFPVSGGRERRKLQGFMINENHLELDFKIVGANSGRGTFQLK